MRPTVADVMGALQRRYPPALAEEWDRVGLVVGDPGSPVGKVVFAVDPTDGVAAEAVAAGAGLLVTHHPLLLRGVHSVAASTGKGRVVHRLIRGNCALFTMHTNADAADRGTNAELARLLGLRHVRPLSPAAGPALEKLVVFVPAEHRAGLLAALFEAGAGRIGDYDQCAYWSEGTGQFRPLAGADPYVGTVGSVERVREDRVEMVLPASRRAEVVAALRRAHPYEEPAFDIWPTAPVAAAGIGRVGELDRAVTLRDFARRVAAILPPTPTGIRVAGDPQRMVRRVAICSGAGDSLLGLVRRIGADVYLTADLRHHPAEEHLAEGGCALVDVSHWASEHPWLAAAAHALRADLADAGFSVETEVSRLCTDPWTFEVGGPN